MIEHGWAQRDAIERVGIDDQRLVCRLDEAFERVDGGFARANAWSNADGGVFAVETYVGKHELVVVGLEHGFGYGGLRYLIGALWSKEGDLAGTCPQSCGCREHGCPHHAEAACDDTCRTEVGFAAKSGAGFEQAPYLGFLDEVEIGFAIVGGFAAQPDVEHFPTSDEFGIVGKEERDAGELDGESEVGVDDVASLGTIVPLAEHAAGDVDRDHCGTGLIDVAHECHEATGERFAQSGAEESVDDEVGSSDVGGIEGVDNLVEVCLWMRGAELVAQVLAVVLDGVAADVEEINGGVETPVD